MRVFCGIACRKRAARLFRCHFGGLAVALLATANGRSLELVSLNEGALHPSVEFTDTVITNHTGRTIEVYTAGKDEWPNVTFKAVGQPWNLRGYYTVKADFTNLGSAPLYLGIRLDSSSAVATETPQHAQGFELLEPAEMRTISVRLSSEDWVFSEPLELVGMRRPPGGELMDLVNIDQLQIFAGHVHEPGLFAVSNIRAEGSVKKVDPAGYLPFIDTYGQYKHGDWDGKVRSEHDFEKYRLAEEKDLSEHPGLSGLGRFGGWTEGPKLNASGFFRVEKVDGKWWMVDPDGYLFWSTGPTCMNPDFGYTGTEFRETYFEHLPKGGVYDQFYVDCTWAPHGFYNDKIPFKILQFYKLNLYRKYGEDWMDQFVDLSHRRLKSWGMNTVANWALPDVYLKQRTPYVASFFIRGNRELDGSRGYWGKFHDVFDPSFRAVIQSNMTALAEEAADPWCIGFYVDNELSWGYDAMSLAVETLSCPADQPAKQEFIADLKTKYGRIEHLNLAWGSDYDSWRALLDSTDEPDLVRAGEDLRRFYAKICDTYFKTIQEELKAAAPNHLYLGCRFAWVNDTVAVAASRYCDVVSYNKYEHSIRSMRLPHFIDRPMIIGEYHFGSTERGHFHPGLREADTHAGRAGKFKDYMKSALDNPQMVGVHWFQYVDEHITGRADGENYNVGLVDICDTPYPEMVDALREVGAMMYTYRMNKTGFGTEQVSK
ncbi:beta-galactosidase [Pontiella agarivorans]|uniref:Beta-galactosidase n=1 Tax=Pontiella agarivorans TaxID=3038953 RepID=A0ABU5MTK7_9BACT|nr:beta-galactosidase [Pontiella agarivorans]MDZ8117525.1 beta-galactosidase [Pontiella agarivorans]